MASLTPLSKGLMGLAIVGGMASAVWHLGLKEKLSGDSVAAIGATAPATASAPTTATSTVAMPQSALVIAPTHPTPAPTPARPDTEPHANKTNSAHNTDNGALGRKLLEAGDYAQARTHLEAAVQAGDASSACHLGEMTLKGQGGISANQEKAAALFQLAQSRGAICFTSGK